MNGMFAELAIVGATFASVSAALATIGLLARDLFSKPDTSRPRLELAEPQPEGDLNRWFFRLVEESGTFMDMTTATAVVIGGGVLGLGLPLVMFENLLGAAGGLILGITLPIVYLSVLRWWRVGTMQKQMPQALQAVADAVRSGQTLSEACQLVSKEIKGPLGQEFAYAHQQLELGHAPVSVMNRMATRVPLTEFRVFATAVVVHRRAGGNLSLLTERMSHSARDRQDVRNHLMAVTSGSRLSAFGMVLGGIIAVAFLTWLEPDYVRAFLENPKGPWLLFIAFMLQVVGAIWVWRILKVNY
ncbi:type II secretion system protein [Pirellula staleyi DSM 6068]|uniref:Type II secretion system protein n=1 Tax=Pirellula staleyi (strain ATCC 27377 / DSM 6068 / ICPB 4128) TaxID=530564 RepID=D2R8E3_PIRSD|nr:type II secretion system F family protein [Pirellula staleyi]ADB15760.1 type II secretion system protein [Pirellula staleyi DSM 6068]